MRQGITDNEGWCATIEIDGARYRRSRVSLPKPATHHFSITTVYMNSQEEYRGEYHLHPYGEINCAVQIDEGAELQGMKGWQGAGWTSPAAGTHHYPVVSQKPFYVQFTRQVVLPRFEKVTLFHSISCQLGGSVLLLLKIWFSPW